jgi:Gpi18-like mannosyltransferase
VTENQRAERRNSLKEALAFAITMWLFSRLVIFVAMLLIAPALPVPASGEPPLPGWEVFARWDGRAYEKIAATGYQFKNNGKGYNVAFFPLFPLLIRAGMSLGLSAAVAGTVINSLAFLGALVVLYLWVQERHGQKAARWSTAALAWCPFSLFGTVVYTEGLFLLCSTAALRAFDRQQYIWAAVWGALTSATRPPGIALVPTFLVTAWREKRGVLAYLTAIACSAGLLLYMLYCWQQFDQPLAFLLAQRGWRPPQKFFGAAWVSLFLQVLFGPVNEDERQLVDPWYPLAVLTICGAGLLLWRSRQKLGFSKAGYGLCLLAVLLWLVGGAPLVIAVMVFGGGYLLWSFRHQLTHTALFYGLFSWLIILGVGRTISAERFAYGSVSLAIAFGLLLSRYPRWGYPTLIFFAILLANLSVRFAQKLWAG